MAQMFQLFQPVFLDFTRNDRCVTVCGLHTYPFEGVTMSDTLYQKYGGFGVISRVVIDFYDRLLDSETVGDYFDNVDMKRLIDHQTKFISAIMGGPATFSDEHIAGAHKHLVVSDFHFDRLKELVRGTLSDFDFASDDIETVLDAFEQRRLLIVRPQNVD